MMIYNDLQKRVDELAIMRRRAGRRCKSRVWFGCRQRGETRQSDA